MKDLNSSHTPRHNCLACAPFRGALFRFGRSRGKRENGDWHPIRFLALVPVPALRSGGLLPRFTPKHMAFQVGKTILRDHLGKGHQLAPGVRDAGADPGLPARVQASSSPPFLFLTPFGKDAEGFFIGGH